MRAARKGMVLRPELQGKLLFAFLPSFVCRMPCLTMRALLPLPLLPLTIFHRCCRGTHFHLQSREIMQMQARRGNFWPKVRNNTCKKKYAQDSDVSRERAIFRNFGFGCRMMAAAAALTAHKTHTRHHMSHASRSRGPEK